MLAAQVDPFYPELKESGSDYNLFFSPTVDAAAATSFPNQRNLSQWQGRAENQTSDDPVTCQSAAGAAGSLIVSSDCSSSFAHNATDLKFRFQGGSDVRGYVINVDCEGDWANCAAGGTSSTRVCLDTASPWSPTPPPSPAVDNQGWVIKADGTIVQVASMQCLQAHLFIYIALFVIKLDHTD